MDSTEQVLASQVIETERKRFTVQRCQNRRGCFLRLREEYGKARNMVIVQEMGVDRFGEAIAAVLPSSAFSIPMPSALRSMFERLRKAKRKFPLKRGSTRP